MITLRSVAVLLVLGFAAFMPREAAAQTVPATAQIKSPFSGLCAEAVGGSTASGVKINQVACASGVRQQWDFRAASGGYQIVSKNSNLCMGVSGASLSQGASAVQESCSGAASQRWTARAAGAAVNLLNANSGQCLEIGGASTASGAMLSQWNCTAGATQQTWSLLSAAPSVATIVGVGSGRCVNIPNGSTGNGVQADILDCAGAAQTDWNLRPSAAGGFQIINRNSNLCLSIYGGGTANGALVAQWPCADTGANGRWTLRETATGTEIIAANSGKCLTVQNATTTNGGKLIQYDCSGGGNETWKLVNAAPSILVNVKSGKCANVPGASTAAGTQTALYDCIGAVSEDWVLRASPAGGYQISNRSSNQCLNVYGGSTANSATVVQWTCSPSSSAGGNERWNVRDAATGTEIVSVSSGKCLTVQNATTTNDSKLIQYECTGQGNETWTVLSGPQVSQWSQKFPLSLVPVSASALTNGKVLTWSAYDRFAFGSEGGKTYTSIFDPATGTATERLVSDTGQEMFCPGTAVLADGRILVNGGSSSAKASVYDPATNAWSSIANMNVPRGYEADTLLSTGEVLTVGGSWSGGQGNKIGEAWTQAGGWRKLPGVVAETLAGPDPAGIYRGDNHMWLFGVANGYAFHAGPSAAMHWISTTGNGAITNAGNRADDPYAINGNVVMYDAGKILKMGGAPAYQDTIATASAYTIDFSQGPAQPVAVAKQKPMAFPRAFANAVVLPNGQVVVHGGQAYPVPFGDADSITIPEIWTPSTGAFTPLARTATPRNYHSIAQLLLDGRVLVGGGGLCGSCATNHPDVEILTPPYLLNADGSAAARPTIQAAPATAGLGALISVITAAPVSSFAIVRLSATTHSVNNDQRRLSLPVESTSGATYGLRLPSDRGTLIAGDWMLFAMTDGGTPSVAKVIRVQ